MTFDELSPGEAFIIETLSEDMHMRGWAMKRIQPDEHTRGIVHLALLDRYGREYRYRITVAVDD